MAGATQFSRRFLLAGAFCRPFGTWHLISTPLPGLKAWAIFALSLRDTSKMEMLT
jgi:hypothetical protein